MHSYAPSKSPTVATSLVESIMTAECTHLFGLMGDGNMELFQALPDTVEVVEVRHEGAAIAMAEGYAWSSGRVGFCSVTHGPGLTHAATSLVVASRNRTPLVLVVAETAKGYMGAQRLDQSRFVEACGVPYRQLASNEDPKEALAAAVEFARARSTPVVFAVASDVFGAPAGADHGSEPREVEPVRPSMADDSAAADALVSALAAAERPVLFAGRGAISAAGQRAAEELAERFGALLTTTVPAKGLFDGHPYNLGICGGLAHPVAMRLLRQADLIVAIGCSLERNATQSMRLFRDASVLQLINEQPAEEPPASVTRLFCTAERTLRIAVGDKSTASARAPWFGSVDSPQESWTQDLREFAPQISPGCVDPRLALSEISKLIPNDAIVIVGNGHCSTFVCTFTDTPPSGRFFAAHGFGSIGQAFPTAVGAALGDPSRKVVVFEGDAAFMMHVHEVETAARVGANVAAFVLNDEALGAEYQRLVRAGSGAELATVPTPDLSSVAQALGARASAIKHDVDVATAAGDALAPGLAVVDVRVERAVVNRLMRDG